MNVQAYVLPGEAELYVQSVKSSELEDVGSPRWFGQHKLIYKLSLQAVLSAKHEQDEYVKDFFVTCAQVPVLVHELLLVELWKEKIFPQIIESGFSPLSNVPLHTVLYHETALCSLLCALFYHEDVIETSSNLLVDLIDYCHRKLVSLLQGDRLKSDESLTEEMSEIIEKNDDIEFFLQMESISLLSEMLQNIKILPLSALHRMLNIHDVPMIVASVVMKDPWQRKSERPNAIEKFIEGNWTKIETSDSQKLIKVQGQAWIVLYQLLLVEECGRKYDITDHRKNQLLKLRPRLSGTLISQMPILEEMSRYLETLSLYEPPFVKPIVVIEQVPEIRENLLKNYDGKWKDIAEKQAREFFAPLASELNDVCKRLSQLYDVDTLEAMASEPERCAYCHMRCKKRCSRCMSEWYCGRKCQVAHWKSHKLTCVPCCSGDNPGPDKN